MLAHAVATNQIIVTSNHDMVLLCAEQRQSVVWIDPYGRQFRLDELAATAFGGIYSWEQSIVASADAVCVRVLRTKTEVMTLGQAAESAATRMRALKRKTRKRVRPAQGQVPGQLGVNE